MPLNSTLKAKIIIKNKESYVLPGYNKTLRGQRTFYAFHPRKKEGSAFLQNITKTYQSFSG